MAYIDDLIGRGDQLFSKRGSLLSLWQDIADNFYPERADFTTVRNLGTEFGTNLMTSYPILARRDLGDSIGSMLRPTSKAWFHARTENYDDLGPAARAWLQGATKRMRIAMHNRKSQFSRATKEGDHDFAAFGQCCIRVSLNSTGDGMLYRCYHLRDVAWCEGVDGSVDTVYRKWKPTAADLRALFKDKVHPNIAKVLDKTPYREFEVVHCIIPVEAYNGDKTFRTKFVSIYYDVENKHIMEEVGLHAQEYVVPRWSTVSGSQYAYSPSTVAALPDARLLQAMTRVLLEAGEKAVNPPMIAVQEAIRSDVSIFAGGITWADAAYDERLGEVLRPLTQDKGGIPLGIEMSDRLLLTLKEAFYLNRLSLPTPGADMTAYEVGQRVQEYIRQAMPLFEPMEDNYDQPLCDNTFQTMMRSGAFGSPFDIPEELQGEDIEFVFESPLHDAIEREKGQRFLEGKSMIAQAIELDADAGDILDAGVALRDVLEGIGVPAKWTRSEDEVKSRAASRLQAQQSAEILAQMQQGADVAKTLNEAGQISPQPTQGVAGV
jgi:hypothetical protein